MTLIANGFYRKPPEMLAFAVHIFRGVFDTKIIQVSKCPKTSSNSKENFLRFY